MLRRKDDIHVPFWSVRTLQDIVAQAPTMWELQKYNVDIACLSKVRISDSGYTMIKVPGEGASCHTTQSGVVTTLEGMA